MKVSLGSAIALIVVAGLAIPCARAETASVNAQVISSRTPPAPGGNGGVHKPGSGRAPSETEAADVVGNDHAAAAAIPSPDGEAGSGPAVRIRIGRASRLLTGPWRFHLGDDLRWAAPGFDDSRWESMDLTPAAGAHDSDVGLTDYVPGWSARGHKGYAGYAWYRMRIAVTAPADARIALLAPAYVEDVYQVFWNGSLIGGAGDFSGKTPVIYSTRPQIFRLPPGAANAHDGVIAIRVWMRPGLGGRGPDAGGIHIPPTLGTTEAIGGQYRREWLQSFYGYVVEVVEPLAFVLLALLAWCFRAAISRGHFVHWLCAALLLTAAYRLNQAAYAWMPYESLFLYGFVHLVLIPLGLAAWVMTWRHWYRLERWRWLTWVIGIITVLSVATVLSVVLGLKLPQGMFGMLRHILHTPLAIVLSATAIVGLFKRQPDRVLAFIVAMLVGASQFGWLETLGVPGIWFPFGVGVSLTQYLYVGIIVGVAALLIRSVQRVVTNRLVFA